MNGDICGLLCQGIQKGPSGVVPDGMLSAENNVDSLVCVQTGEEFSTEFLRDRLTPKSNVTGSSMALNQDMAAGVHNDHICQLGYEDLARVLGLSRINSECGSDVSEYVSAKEFPSQVDSRAPVDGTRRCLINDTEKGRGLKEASAEVNFDQATLGLRIPPIAAPHSPHPLYLFESGTSDGPQPGKIRILCSFGGKILPRPSDAKLRYVGGETRIISIWKNISWKELLHKTTGFCNQAHSIKYQLPGEDLDALISVSSDEDLQNMMEEYRELEMQAGSQRLRIFLIPTNEGENQSSFEAGNFQQDSPDYEYVVALNGILDPSPRKSSQEQIVRDEVNKSNGNYDYNPSFHGDSPSSLHHVSRLSKEATLSTISPSHSPSFFLKPVQHTNTKPDSVQWSEDKPSINTKENNDSSVTAQQSLDHHLGKQNLHTSKSRFHARSSSKEFVPPPPLNHCDRNQKDGCSIAVPLPEGRVINSENCMPQVDDGRLKLGSMNLTGSHSGMVHAFSDSQLQQYGGKSFCSQDGLSPSSPLNFAKPSVPSQDKLILTHDLHKPMVQNSMVSVEFTKSDRDMVHHCPLYPEALVSYKNSEVLHSPAKDHEDKSSTMIESVYRTNPTCVEVKNQVVCPHSYLNHGAFDGISLPPMTVEYKLEDKNHCQFDANLQGISHFYQYSNTDVVHRRQSSFQAGDIVDDARHQVDKDVNQMKPLIDVDDVSNGTFVGDSPMSAVACHLVDVPCDEFTLPSVTEGDDISSGLESHNITDEDKDDPINNALIAEIEAGIYGLQIIKNVDLEELRELGSGTYGTVYHGKWRGSDVAIKRIKKSCFSGRLSEEDRLTKDFWREAQILSKLHHPNVVAFYGVVPDGAGGTLATVTEYMVNGSLRNALIKKDRTLDRRQKLVIAMDAAFGMEYLHSKNIVHFDLKCDNLLVNLRDPQRPICKVGDFGLSRIKRNTLVSGGVRGTLPWMAPELLNGSSNKVSEKVDVFSFGVAMWEILTGEEPYANMHCGAIIGGILKDTLRPPIPERCDNKWRKLMEQCWSTDPVARPSFSEVADRLQSMSAALLTRGHRDLLVSGIC
ncbi:hypothetical protein Dimus_032607 [Dionaea muscipula]